MPFDLTPRRSVRSRHAVVLVSVAALLTAAATSAGAQAGDPQQVVTADGVVQLIVGDRVVTIFDESLVAPELILDVDGTLLHIPDELEPGLARGQHVTVTMTAPAGLSVDEAVTLAGVGAGVLVTGVSVTTAAPVQTGPPPADGVHHVTVLPVRTSAERPFDLSQASPASAWSARSGGRLTFAVDVRDVVTIEPADVCDPLATYNRARVSAGVSVPASLHDHIVVFGGELDCHWDGLAVLGGSQVWALPKAGIDFAAAEFGHNLGLGDVRGMACTDGGVAVPLSATCHVSTRGTLGFDVALASTLGWATVAPAPPTDAVQVVDLGTRFHFDTTDIEAVRIPMPDGDDVFISPGESGVTRLHERDGVPDSQVLTLRGPSEPNRIVTGDVLRFPGSAYAVSVISATSVTARVQVTPVALDTTAPTAPVLIAPTNGWLNRWAQPVAGAPAVPGPIEWTPATDAGLGVAGYSVWWNGELCDTVPASQTSVYPHFGPTGPVSIVVVATDAAGNSTSSAPLQATVGDPPNGYFRATAGDATVEVAIQESVDYPLATSYTVSIAPEAAGSSAPGAAVREVQAGVPTVVFTGLANRVPYRVSMIAHSPVGSSSPAWTEVVTPVSPTEWLSISVTPAGDSSGSLARLTWVAGPDVQSRLAYYVVNLDGRPLRFVGPETSALDLRPVSAYGEPLSVTAFDAAGVEIMTSETVELAGTYTPVITFSDVTQSSPFFREITWLAQAGITTGNSDGTFRPTASLSREAMAAFLYRMSGAEVTGYTAPAAPQFSDVPVTHPFYAAISWLAESGITTGYGDGSFGVSRTVSREALAAFLYRYADAAADGYVAPATPMFTDVTSDSSRFYTEISWLAEAGITTGFSDGSFGPSNPISRAAVAAFLCRYAGGDTWT